MAKGFAHITFEPWCPYEQLAGRIGRADILLGVFGESEKAGRVIPNKAYQALACGRPLVTRESLAYPQPLRKAGQSGITFISSGSPEVLAQAVHALLDDIETLQKRGQWARKSYESWFSEEHISQRLLTAIADCLTSR